MRDPNRVQLQLAIDPLEKDLIRRLARAERQTMTRFVLRLVHDFERRAVPSADEVALQQP